MKGIVKKVKITGSKPVKAGKKLKLKAKVTATKKANTNFSGHQRQCQICHGKCQRES
ncbi:MAG: hypothetical protein ACLRYY_08550 [Anaerobutyricum soehngenii]